MYDNSPTTILSMIVFSYNKDLFTKLIVSLNNQKIKYCIIGDYYNLPESVGHDIDLWTNDVTCFRKVLFKAVETTGFKVIIDNRTANGCNVAIYKREDNIIYLMKIDVMVDTAWKSVLTLVDKDMMAGNIMPFKDFYVVNPESEAVMHFLYPMFEWGEIKKDVYKEDIHRYCKSDIFKKCFTTLWGEHMAIEVLTLIENKKWDEIQKRMTCLKRMALVKSLFKCYTYENVLRTFYYIIRRKFKPSGKVLAFCGLDGAGKTTILDEMNDMFKDLLKSKKVFYGYWRPYVIPEIRELFGKKNSKAGVDKQAQKGVTVKEPERKPKNIITSFMKLCYFWVDYILASYKYGSIHERGGMVLFDRHYVDMAVHSQRFEMKLPQWLILFMYRFIPKADYTFFLYCTPDEILKRKQEFTKEEIQEMTDNYIKCGKKIKNFVPVHTNTTLEEEIDEILSHVTIK